MWRASQFSHLEAMVTFDMGKKHRKTATINVTGTPEFSKENALFQQSPAYVSVTFN